ncbi:MAG TPA: serine protease [Pseudonocardiaceae bacterium]
MRQDNMLDSSIDSSRTWLRRAVALVGGAALATTMGMAAPGVAMADKGKPAEQNRAAAPTFGTKPRAQVAATPTPLLTKDKQAGPETRPNGPNTGPGTQIVGGAPASVGEYPYFVSLQSSSGGTGDFFCGGSLLSTTRVLTAAHCVDGGTTAGSLQVTIGGTTLSGSDVGVVRNISAINVHPGWNPSTFQNDVAILTLATPITRTDAGAQWLRLAQGNELGMVDPGDPTTVIGHGSTSSGGPTSNQLLEVSVPIQSDAAMSAPSSYGAQFHGPTMIGAGPMAGGQDSCQGDSGGPLVLTGPSQDVQIGDVSWGFGCAAANFPGVYGELYQGGMATFVNGLVARPSNDTFGGSTGLGGNAGSIAGSNENATMDPAEPGGEATVWYHWTPTESGNAQISLNQHGFDSQISVYTGASVNGLTLVGYNDDANGTLQSELELTVTAGVTYRIQVDGFAFDYGAFRLSYGVNREVNDDFAAAGALSGAVSCPIHGTNSRATGQAGETATNFGSADSTLWYSWTAPESGTARFSSGGSNFDTVLAAYTGASVNALTLVASNDDANGTLQSQMSFGVTAGVTYRIQLGGYNGARGNTVLQYTVNAAGNDLFAGAPTMLGGSGTVFGNNVRAITEPGEPALHGSAESSAWFRWTAPSNGIYRFTTTGSNFDTVLAAASGSFITGLTLVASNDDTNGTLQSQIDFTATGGTTYYLWVDGFGCGRGSIQLNWSTIG